MIIKKIELLPPEKHYIKIEKQKILKEISYDYIFVGSKNCKRIARFKKVRNAELFVKIVSFVINIKIKIKSKIVKVKDAIKNAFKRKRNKINK